MWERLQQFLWQNRGIGVAVPLVAGTVILVRWAGLLQVWEWNAYDLYMRWRPPELGDGRIAIVGIDEEDLHRRQEAIVSDRTLAELLTKLKQQQPRAIGLDFYRDLPVPPGHQSLVKIFQETPNLVGIEKVAGKEGREKVAPPPVLKAKGQVGANDLIFDGDNRVRRGLIALTHKGETAYSFSLYLALHYLEQEGITPQILEDGKTWKLGKALFGPLEANDGGYVRTDAGGYQLPINYRGGNRHFETVSGRDILEGKVPGDWGRDRLILVGAVGESLKDLYFTPYSGDLFALPRPVPGVEVHANLASQIISAALEGRPLIRNWPEPVEWLWIVFWSGVGATLSWRWRHLGGSNFLSWPKSSGFVAIGGFLFLITYKAFCQGWWLPVVPGFLALGGSAVAITAYVAGTAVRIRQTFGRYLTDEVVGILLESPSGLKLGGERRKITILTSDLRGFTATAEQLSPEKVIEVLNFYLGRMTDIIVKYRGTIDEFMGDGILVLFGVPVASDDDGQKAIACAIEMQLAMADVNQKMAEWGLSQLEMGIGINTGEAIVGNIGSEKRTQYGAIGSEVNLTYRIESYTTGGEIFISEATLKEAGEAVIIEGEMEVEAKGFSQPFKIYSVIGIASRQYNLRLTYKKEDFFTLDIPVNIQYRILEEKHVGDTLFPGKLVKLSANEAAILLIDGKENYQQLPEKMTDLKLNFLDWDLGADVGDDIYAKVIEVIAEKSEFYLRFTVRSPAIAVQLDALYKTLKSQSNKSI